MKKRIVLLTVVTILLMAGTASASSHTYAGDRIDLNIPPLTYPANIDFNVHHGWKCPVGRGTGEQDSMKENVRGSFALEVDGEFVGEDFVDRYVDSGFFTKFYVVNFYGGLDEGYHTFTGHWYNVCKYYGETCANPNQIVEVSEKSITVLFTAP